MSAAQELLDVIKDAKPSPNMERKPVKQAPQPPAAQAPMCARIPPKRVALQIGLHLGDETFLELIGQKTERLYTRVKS